MPSDEFQDTTQTISNVPNFKSISDSIFSSEERVPAICFRTYHPPIRLALALHRWGCVVLPAFMYIVAAILILKKSSTRWSSQAKRLTKQESSKIKKATVTMALSTVNAVFLLLVPDVILYFHFFDSEVMVFILFSLILNKVGSYPSIVEGE
ncbi:unnamed protein product [Cylicocyclus nassatus]|uniref:Uncharacterized protein n=1 Tax=Cylicocyclus nassatus TaxID=53992 RepID=A0AA36H4S6_CYLNA|nr:unnamed protein product [Cylicocyclus nassatus]